MGAALARNYILFECVFSSGRHLGEESQAQADIRTISARTRIISALLGTNEAAEVHLQGGLEVLAMNLDAVQSRCMQYSGTVRYRPVRQVSGLSR